MNYVCAGKIADSEMDTWMTFHVGNVLHFFVSVGREFTFEHIRVDQRRKFLVVSMHLVFSG